MIAAAARSLLAEAALKGAKLLLAMTIGALLLFSGCATAGAGATVINVLALVTVGGGTPVGGSLTVSPNAPGFPIGGPFDPREPLPPIPLEPGARVGDAQRYALALGAWGDVGNAILGTALSFAENCGRPVSPRDICGADPAALSPLNFDNSRDLGLWQINSGWWPQFGGYTALIIPANNAHAAAVIYGRQGWCAWSTYERACGPGHTSSYAGFLWCARLLAGGQSCN